MAYKIKNKPAKEKEPIMYHYKIELKAIGRENTNETFSINAYNLDKVEDFAEKECRKHLISSDVQLFPMNKNGLYGVYAGFRKVGEVKITKTR